MNEKDLLKARLLAHTNYTPEQIEKILDLY